MTQLVNFHFVYQIELAFKDFFKKSKSFNLIIIIAFSAVIKTFIMLVSFLVCSPLCLDMLDYKDFVLLLSIFLVVFHVFNLYKKSDISNWCYNLVRLLLIFLLLFLVWTLVRLCINGVYLAINALLSSFIFAESTLDVNEDFDNPFTQSAIFTITALLANLDNGGTLNMEGDSGNGQNTHSSSGGSGNSGNSGGNGGGGGPDPGTVAAVVGSGSAAASQYDPETGAVIVGSENSQQDESDTRYFVGKEVSPIDSDKLGDLRNDTPLRISVHTEKEMREFGGHRIPSLFANPLLDEDCIRDFFEDNQENNVSLRNLNREIEVEIEIAKEECQVHKKNILDSEEVLPEDKERVIDNLEANLASSIQTFSNTVKATAEDILQEISPTTPTSSEPSASQTGTETRESSDD